MVLAAIDIGSHATKLKVVEYKHHKYKTLDEIFYPLSLGAAVYQSGKIDSERRDEIIKCLSHFKKLFDEYGVEKYMALATGVFRVARNGHFIIDLIEKKVNLKVEIVEESIERFLTYLSLDEAIDNFQKMRREGLLLVEVGSNSSEVIIYKNNKLMRNNELHMGTLSLKDLIFNIRRASQHTPQILEDYIYGATENLQNYLVRKRIDHFVIMGTDIKRFHAILGDDKSGFSRAHFDDIYKKIDQQDREIKHILEKEHLDYDETLAAMTIYAQFVKHSTADFVHVPKVNLRDGIIRNLVEDILSYQRNQIYTSDIIKAAKQIAKRHHSTASHINQLDKFVIKLFDAYREFGDYSDKDLLLLRLAVILHETGKFSRQVDYSKATYHAIINASLLGVSKEMLNQIAQIAKYFFDIVDDANFDFDSDEHIDTKLLRLAMLLAIGDALDKSKRSRLTIKKVKITKNHIRIKVFSKSNYFLEKITIEALNPLNIELFARDIILEE